MATKRLTRRLAPAPTADLAQLRRQLVRLSQNMTQLTDTIVTLINQIAQAEETRQEQLGLLKRIFLNEIIP